jgi:hypothetical protein
MARHMHERLHAQRTGNVFRLLEAQARRLWRMPGQAEIAEQAQDRSIVEAFTLSLQQAARWECQENGAGRLALTVGHRRMRIARNAMFHLIRQWLEHHEACSWQIRITGDGNVANLREWREAKRGAPLDITGTYGLRQAGKEPCQGLIVPLAPATRMRERKSDGGNERPDADRSMEPGREKGYGKTDGMEAKGAGDREEAVETGVGTEREEGA